MGLGDKIRSAILGSSPIAPVKSAMDKANAGTTSGLDAAMQAHADQVHPTGYSGPATAPGKIKQWGEQ